MPTKRKAKTKTTKKPNPAASAGAPNMKVRVRMYRQGLGDCFLLTFDPGGPDEKHILIDCGSLGATTTKKTLSEVVDHIKTSTGRHLSALIATHEHKDHLSGFNTCKNVFKDDFTVDNVWLAWTEDPKDPLAKTLAKSKKDLGTALASASKALKQSSSLTSQAIGAAVEDLITFFGDEGVLGAGAFSETINDAMNFVRTGLKAKVQFHNPGDGPLEEAWLPGFRFYVLGPPRDKNALDDTGEHGSSELYGIAAGLQAAADFHLSGDGKNPYAARSKASQQADDEWEMPFDSAFRCNSRDAKVRSLQGTYFAPAAQWRRVDDDWLHMSAELALQLDSSTNNTSLALAIERISDGKVLLFPADAQQGNWLSWHGDKMVWEVKQGSGKREVRIGDLLAKTVFYKVGHHSSHNATAKAKGLELMTQEDELTAFIPVDRAVALGRNPKGSWKMPARNLYLRLLQKCQGRVVRSDLGWANDASQAANKAVEKEFVGMGTAADWKKWRAAQAAASHVEEHDLYIDYTLN
jgi:hypothetical protein